jgi:hypothetical protein
MCTELNGGLEYAYLAKNNGATTGGPRFRWSRGSSSRFARPGKFVGNISGAETERGRPVVRYDGP